MIIFDASVLFGLHRGKPEFDLLRALKRSGVERAAIPWMVREELTARQVLDYIDAHERAATAVDGLNRKSPWSRRPHRSPALNVECAREHWRGIFEEVFEILDTSGEAARQALLREAYCEKPAKGDANRKGGARDAAIWLSVVEYVRAHPNEAVYFVSNNTKDFGDGSFYPHPMSSDLRGIESRLTHLTSFDDFVSRFTEPIEIDKEHVRDVLEGQLGDSPTPIETAADSLLVGVKGVGFNGTRVDNHEPVRWEQWWLPPSAVLSKIDDALGHRIGTEEWYSASVDWILAGFSRLALGGSISTINIETFNVACEWRTKLLFSTRSDKTVSLIDYQPPEALELAEKEQWEPLVDQALASQTATLAECWNKSSMASTEGRFELPKWPSDRLEVTAHWPSDKIKFLPSWPPMSSKSSDIEEL